MREETINVLFDQLNQVGLVYGQSLIEELVALGVTTQEFLRRYKPDDEAPKQEAKDSDTR